MDVNILISAVVSILLILIAVILFFARKYLPVWEAQAKATVGASQWETLKSLARTLILAAEQVAEKQGLDTGAKKKEFVVNKLVLLANQLNIPATHAHVDTLVEGILKEIKRESSGLVLGELKEATGNWQ